MKKGNSPAILDRLRKVLRTEFQGVNFNVKQFLSSFSLGSAIASIAEGLKQPAPAWRGTQPAGQPAQGLPKFGGLSAGWRTFFAKFIISHDTHCVSCMSSKHGLYNCPLLYKELADC